MTPGNSFDVAEDKKELNKSSMLAKSRRTPVSTTDETDNELTSCRQSHENTPTTSLGSQSVSEQTVPIASRPGNPFRRSMPKTDTTHLNNIALVQDVLKQGTLNFALLPTAQFRVATDSGVSEPVRALWDTGAQVNLIATECRKTRPAVAPNVNQRKHDRWYPNPQG